MFKTNGSKMVDLAKDLSPRNINQKHTSASAYDSRVDRSHPEEMKQQQMEAYIFSEKFFQHDSIEF